MRINWALKAGTNLYATTVWRSKLPRNNWKRYVKSGYHYQVHHHKWMFGHSSTIIIFVTTSFIVFFTAGFPFHEMLGRKSAGEEGPTIYIVESRKFHVVGSTRISCVCLLGVWRISFFAQNALLTKSSWVYYRFHDGCMRTVQPKVPQSIGLCFF